MNLLTNTVKAVIVSTMFLAFTPAIISNAFAATDTDGDGVPDSQDNCTLVANPTQCDGDNDGYGNHCDADFNDDLIVNGLDIGPMKASFGTADPITDLNCDGIVNGLDIGPLKVMFGTPPGPSCVTNPEGCQPPVVTQCADGLDNDGDGEIDYPADPGCANVTDDDETDVAPPVFPVQTDFKIMMNYELGMHCTGFEFAYCCVLPACNSILAQVVKPDSTGQGYPELMAGDPNVGRDALGRETVVRDRERNGNSLRNTC